MKNKKGFTLVELLAVVTILAVITLIAIPSIDSIVNKNTAKLYDVQVKTIKDSLKIWGDMNASNLPNEGETLWLDLGTLKQAGLIDLDFKNTATNSCFSNDTKLYIKNVNNVYKYDAVIIDENSSNADCVISYTGNRIVFDGSKELNMKIFEPINESFGISLISEEGLIIKRIKEDELDDVMICYDENDEVCTTIDNTDSHEYRLVYNVNGVSATKRIIIER